MLWFVPLAVGEANLFTLLDSKRVGTTKLSDALSECMYGILLKIMVTQSLMA